MVSIPKCKNRVTRLTNAAATLIALTSTSALLSLAYPLLPVNAGPSAANNNPSASNAANSKFPGGWVFLNSNVAGMVQQKFALPQDTFNYSVVGQTSFPYYEASPQLKAFLNSTNLTSIAISPAQTPNMLVPTDLMPKLNITRPPGQPDDRNNSRVANADRRLKNEIPWMVAREGAQAFGIPGDNDALALVSAGSMFGGSMQRTMILRFGTMWILTGSRPAAVLTRSGAVAVKPFSVAAVGYTWYNRLQVASLFGQPVELQPSKDSKAEKVTIATGQQLTLTDTKVASAGVSDYVADPNKAAQDSKQNADSQQAGDSNATGSNVVTEKVDPANSGLINELKGLTPPFTNPRMDAEFRKMLAGYGVSPEMRRDEIQKQVLKRRELATRPAINKLGHYPPAPLLIGQAAGTVPTLTTGNNDQAQTASASLVQQKEELRSMSLGRRGKAKFLTSTAIETQPNGSVLLKSGEAIISAEQSLVVEANNGTIYMQPGSIVRANVRNGVLAVENIKEIDPASVKVRSKTHKFDCGVGAEVVIGSNAPEILAEMRNDNIARRHLQSIESVTGNTVANSAEIDLATLMQSSPTMHKLYRSKDDSDRALVRDIMQTIVSVNVVKGGGDNYQRMAGLPCTQ